MRTGPTWRLSVAMLTVLVCLTVPPQPASAQLFNKFKDLMSKVTGGAIGPQKPPARMKWGKTGKMNYHIPGDTDFPEPKTKFGTPLPMTNRAQYIERLVRMHYRRDEVMEALLGYNWDVNKAADYLSTKTRGHEQIGFPTQLPCLEKNNCFKRVDAKVKPVPPPQGKLLADLAQKALDKEQAQRDNPLSRILKRAQSKKNKKSGWLEKAKKQLLLANRKKIDWKTVFGGETGVAKPKPAGGGFGAKLKAGLSAIGNKLKGLFGKKRFREEFPEPGSEQERLAAAVLLRDRSAETDSDEDFDEDRFAMSERAANALEQRRMQQEDEAATPGQVTEMQAEDDNGGEEDGDDENEADPDLDAAIAQAQENPFNTFLEVEDTLTDALSVDNCMAVLDRSHIDPSYKDDGIAATDVAFLEEDLAKMKTDGVFDSIKNGVGKLVAKVKGAVTGMPTKHYRKSDIKPPAVFGKVRLVPTQYTNEEKEVDMGPQRIHEANAHLSTATHPHAGGWGPKYSLGVKETPQQKKQYETDLKHARHAARTAGPGWGMKLPFGQEPKNLNNFVMDMKHKIACIQKKWLLGPPKWLKRRIQWQYRVRKWTGRNKRPLKYSTLPNEAWPPTVPVKTVGWGAMAKDDWIKPVTPKTHSLLGGTPTPWRQQSLEAMPTPAPEGGLEEEEPEVPFHKHPPSPFS